MPLNNLPIWVSWAQALGVPALTVVIALIGVWIGWRQERISAMRLQHELYDRRFRAYAAVKALLVSILIEGCVRRTAFQAFIEATSDAEFLFHTSVSQYLEELRRKAIYSMRLSEKLNNRSLEQNVRGRIADEESELIMWFISQFYLLRDRFKPFMQTDYTA